MIEFLHTASDEREALKVIISRERKKMNIIRFSILGIIALILTLNFQFLIAPQLVLIFSLIGGIITFIATMVPKLSSDVSGEITEIEGVLSIRSTNIQQSGRSSTFYVNNVEVLLPIEWLEIMRCNQKSYEGTFRYIEDDNRVAHLLSMNINDRKLSLNQYLKAGRKTTIVAMVHDWYFQKLRP